MIGPAAASRKMFPICPPSKIAVLSAGQIISPMTASGLSHMISIAKPMRLSTFVCLRIAP